MAKIFLVLFLYFSLVHCSIKKNVNLVNYRDYFVSFANEFTKMMEEKYWSNLKLPDMNQEISTTVFGQTLSGTVKYTNGFIVSIQNVDILESNLAGNFDSPSATFATAQVSGTIRMVGVTAGFDAEADVNNKKTHYTGVTTFSLINNNFVIVKDLFTNEITTKCSTTVPWNPTAMTFLPADFLSDIITSSYVLSSANNGVESWSNVFQPVATEVARTKVDFPDICYNCPIE